MRVAHGGSAAPFLVLAESGWQKKLSIFKPGPKPYSPKLQSWKSTVLQSLQQTLNPEAPKPYRAVFSFQCLQELWRNYTAEAFPKDDGESSLELPDRVFGFWGVWGLGCVGVCGFGVQDFVSTRGRDRARRLRVIETCKLRLGTGSHGRDL